MAALIVTLGVPAAQAAQPAEQVCAGLRPQVLDRAAWSFKVVHNPERVQVLDCGPEPLATARRI